MGISILSRRSVKDELKGKPEMQERVRRIAKAINIEHQKLSEEAQH